MILRLLMAVSAAAVLGACQTAARPATLETEGAEEVETLRRVLAEALGRGRVELGAGDLTRDSVISVLPPPPTPLEGNSPAMPELFDLLLTPEGCFVRRQSTDEMFALPGVSCRAVQ
ncbi:hypothetical protein [Hyphomonas sp.]|uniref:hypothetical protein n=1 Tax=Hyphomonas sp. TaxID=87 RepID=UPI003918D58C